jgi:ubiquinone/menaquinone biosynthesis C-methylase UbiE
MDALGIQAGTSVADVGSGDGYFSFHLARRVGPGGRVYGVDIDQGALEKLRRRAEKEGFEQIETIRGAADDPRLPADSVDVVLVVNAYHEMRDYDAMLAGLYRALRPGGLLAIIDGDADAGDSRDSYFSRHRVPDEVVREEAARAGFVFAREEPGFTRARDSRRFYFLVFEKP